MKTNEELLHRCFDGDLNDSEMKELFLEMSKNDELRIQFRSLQTLQIGLRSLSSPNVPKLLDDRIKVLIADSDRKLFPNKSPFRRALSKKVTISIPTFATTILLLLAGSYFAATNIFAPKPETEYVYVLEIEPIIINSSFIQ